MAKANPISLYRTILRLHRKALPPDKRTLGDRQVAVTLEYCLIDEGSCCLCVSDISLIQAPGMIYFCPRDRRMNVRNA